MSERLYFILEIIGTPAFAVSGATVGIKKKMDILGVIILRPAAAYFRWELPKAN